MSRVYETSYTVEDIFILATAYLDREDLEALITTIQNYLEK